MSNYLKVLEFHRAFDVPTPLQPTVPSEAIEDLRASLIQEECDEAYEAMGRAYLPDVAKELADILYVVYGTFLAYGIDADKAFAEVHRSNMSKLTADGQVIRREDGKVLKSDQYSPADMSYIAKEAA